MYRIELSACAVQSEGAPAVVVAKAAVLHSRALIPGRLAGISSPVRLLECSLELNVELETHEDAFIALGQAVHVTVEPKENVLGPRSPMIFHFENALDYTFKGNRCSIGFQTGRIGPIPFDPQPMLGWRAAKGIGPDLLKQTWT